MEKQNQEHSKEKKFVDYVIKRLQDETRFGAALRRGGSPATEYQAWEYLAPWCDITKDYIRRPYMTVAAAIATEKPVRDGSLGLGQALALCYEDGRNAEPAKARLRRLLACETAGEVTSVLRPVLRLIQSRSVRINYEKLLKDLIYFGEKVKLKWASDFYGRGEL